MPIYERVEGAGVVPWVGIPPDASLEFYLEAEMEMGKTGIPMRMGIKTWECEKHCLL